MNSTSNSAPCWKKQQQASSSASRRCSPRIELHRALQGPRIPCRAGAKQGEEARKDRRVTPPKRRQTVLFDFPPAPRSGDDVVTLKGVSKRYGARTIYDGFDFRIVRKERWCVMGINGAGKSTLLKLIAGAAVPDEGAVTVGGSVKTGYFAQHAMEILDGDATIFETLEGAFPQASQGSLRALAGCFGFSGDDVEKRCRVLSGGERARLAMARMLYDPPNFLILDEPTNHLDIATKQMLIAALAEYEGTMLFVSHDRHFLAALSNRVLELTPEGAHLYGGGYVEYVARTGQEARGCVIDEKGAAAFPPRARISSTHAGSASELRGDLRDMRALELRAIKLNSRRLTRAVAARDGGSAIGRAALHFINAHLALEGIGQADNHHTVMQEHGVKVQDGRFLAAMLGGGG